MKLSRKEYQAEWYRQNRDRIRQRDKANCVSKRAGRFAYKLKSLYGLSVQEYTCLSQRQAGMCAICKKAVPLCVDHCHETNKVRGLLCTGCNLALGHFKTNSLLQSAISYLQGEK